MYHVPDGCDLEPLHLGTGWRAAELTVHLGRSPGGGPPVVEAHFPVVGTWGTTEVLEVHQDWVGPASHRAALGRVILRYADAEGEELFTFGGDLTIHEAADETACRLTAPAPIVALQYAPSPVRHEIETDLVSEVEALLARLRATSGLPADEFERRLNEQSPEALFLASLASLEAVLKQLPQALRARRGYQIAGRAVREMVTGAQAAGRWRTEQATLADLLTTGEHS